MAIFFGSGGVVVEVGDDGWHADALPSEFVVERKRESVGVFWLGRNVVRLE